jgi:hypothetical protein
VCRLRKNSRQRIPFARCCRDKQSSHALNVRAALALTVCMQVSSIFSHTRCVSFPVLFSAHSLWGPFCMLPVLHRGRYRTCHTSLSPEEYRAMSMHGNTMHQQDEGGYWIEKASLPGPPRRFTARSTYQEELLDGVNTAAKTYAKTADMSITTCPFFEGTRRSGQDFAMSSSRPIRTAPAALQTQKGDMIGYTTMYKSMVLKDPLTGGTAAPGGPRMPSQEPSTRARVLSYILPSAPPASRCRCLRSKTRLLLCAREV